MDPVSLVVLQNAIVVSHAVVLRKAMTHTGKQYSAFGLGSMVTNPSYRRQGFGRRILEYATEHMEQEGADIGVFTCDPHLAEFYNWNGWETTKSTPLVGGTEGKPFPSDKLGKLTVIQFFSDRAKAQRNSILAGPIYLELGEGKLR